MDEYQRRLERFRARKKKNAEQKSKEKTNETIDLDGMTIAELKAYAEANEIDLGSATKKADILELIVARETDGEE